MRFFAPRPLTTGLSMLVVVGAAFALFEFQQVGEAPQSAGHLPAQVQDYVLALTWHPAHCEIRPRSADCRGGTNDIAATHFSLHGLWPQPYGNFYCGVPDHIIELDKSGAWSRLPPLDISPGLRRDLKRQMPGMQSFLHRHEWVKHGTCYGTSPELYFQHSLDLMAAVNASAVRTEFVGATGSHISIRKISASVDQAFGPGAGDRLRLACADEDGRNLITELRVHFTTAPSVFADSLALGDWMRAAKPVKTDCPGGIVDAPGPG